MEFLGMSKKKTEIKSHRVEHMQLLCDVCSSVPLLAVKQRQQWNGLSKSSHAVGILSNN